MIRVKIVTICSVNVIIENRNWVMTLETMTNVTRCRKFEKLWNFTGSTNDLNRLRLTWNIVEHAKHPTNFLRPLCMQSSADLSIPFHGLFCLHLFMWSVFDSITFVNCCTDRGKVFYESFALACGFGIAFKEHRGSLGVIYMFRDIWSYWKIFIMLRTFVLKLKLKIKRHCP